MPLFDNTLSMEIPLKIGQLNVIFFINKNLFVKNTECASTPHNHHDFEIRYVLSGFCDQIINKQKYSAKEGTVMLVRPYEYHYQITEKESSQYNLRFNILPPSENAPAQEEKAYHSCENILKNIRCLEDQTRNLAFYLKQLTEEVYREKDIYSEILRSLCTLIFIEVFRLSEFPITAFFSPNVFLQRGFSRGKVDEFFRTKYLSDIHINDLANDMKLSERQVNRVIHKMFGMSFTQKLIEMRLEKACSQLIETNLPITKITSVCGFSSDKYFYKCFKKKFGLSPREFRAKYVIKD